VALPTLRDALKTFGRREQVFFADAAAAAAYPTDLWADDREDGAIGCDGSRACLSVYGHRSAGYLARRAAMFVVETGPWNTRGGLPVRS